jgi:transcription termination factor Rho
MIQKPTTDTSLTEASTIILEPHVAAEVEIPAPVPRRRGRPRKNPLPEEQAVGRDADGTGRDDGVGRVADAPAGSDADDAGREQTAARPARPTRAAAARPTRPTRAAASKSDDDSASSEGTSGDFEGEGSSDGDSGLDSGSSSDSGSNRTSGNGSNGGSNDASNGGSNGGSNRGTSTGSGRRSNANSGRNFNNGSNRGPNGTTTNNSGAKGKGGYQNYGGRRPRRNYNSPREQIAPQASREELEALKVAELREKAAELELDISAIRKKEELIGVVLDALVKAEGFVSCEGILDLLPEGYGFLRTSGYLPGEADVYVGMSMVRRNGLRKGDLVTGQVRPARDNEKYAALHRIDAVNGLTLEEARERRRFADLTPVYPDERLLMEHGLNTITARTIDLVAPIGKGQRGLIVSPPKAGKTTILKDIAAAISANNPAVHLMCLLVDERPEEVTDMQRSIRGEVVSSTFDMPSENHIAVAELVIERAKRLVEVGRDVVILLDSITRLARAYNLAQPASGRILSGGVDSTALYPPKRFLGAARNIEDGGSLTILASALIETGSKMDEVIFEEFKGTGNMELRLDRDLADRRIFPAIDPVASGTRKEELLLDVQEAPLIWAVRRILANMNNTERAMEMLIKSLKQTQTNAEFLMRTAKKAQQKSTVEIAEL